MKATETYYYRVQHWHIPVLSPWLPQKWTMTKSVLAAVPPRPGRGVPDIDYTAKGDRITWQWEDTAGTPRRVISIKLKEPITETYEYIDL